MSKDEFVRLNRVLLDTGDDLGPDDLARWREGRDYIATRALELAHEDAERAGTHVRRHARARVAAQAHLAGHGRAFTEEVGFGGLSLRPNASPVEVSQDEEASVRIVLAKRSVYVAGRVAWCSRDRLGVEITSIHPKDEILLQAVVCQRLADLLDEPAA